MRFYKKGWFDKTFDNWAENEGGVRPIFGIE